MRDEMRGERGQAAVEWTGLLLLVALALVALSHLAAKADGRELGTSLAHSVTAAAKHADRSSPASAGPGAPRTAAAPGSPPAAAPRSPRHRGAGSAIPPVRSLPRMPGSLRRATRGVGAVWRRAWFACLVYERTRYSLRHPESRIPGYTLPYGTALRMINNCVSPVDLLRDLPDLDQSQ